MWFFEKEKKKGECGVVEKRCERVCVFWLEVKIEPEKQKGKERETPLEKEQRESVRETTPKKTTKNQHTLSLDQILRTLKEGKENG